MPNTQSIVRLTLLVVPFLLFVATVDWAQPSSPTVASPVAMASPVAGPGEGMMHQHMTVGPMMGGSCPYPPGSGFYSDRHPVVLIVRLILRALLALSAIFALTALGIFLIRRSRPRT